MIRLVTFDFWQTLFADTAGSLERAHALCASGGSGRRSLRWGGSTARRPWPRPTSGPPRAFQAVWREHRDMAPAEQVRRFLDVLDPGLADRLDPPAWTRVAAAYQEPSLRHRPDAVAGAAEATAALRARGLALAVISNTGRTPSWVLRRLLEDAGLLSRFAVLTFSDEAGVRKPAPGIFRETLAVVAVEPSAAVHVGDDPVSDVGGARAAGMRAIHYAPDPAAGASGADAVVRRLADLPTLLDRLG